MRLTPPYTSAGDKLFWRVFPLHDPPFKTGPLLWGQCIVPRLLHSGRWGQTNAIGSVNRPASDARERHFTYWPADMRMPVDRLWLDEA